MRVLLVEDNILLGEGLFDTLQDEGETVDWMKDGQQALSALSVEGFDLAILDLGLPKVDGLEVLRQLRSGNGSLSKNQHIPVLILTARDEIQNRVKGLDFGADDYLVKPFDISELMARMRALTRRSKGRTSDTISVGTLEIRPSERKVSLDGSPISLSRREYALLVALAEKPDQVFTKQQLGQTLYGWGEEVESNALEVHIHNLRKKLQGRFIRTLRGIGYSLTLAEEAT